MNLLWQVPLATVLVVATLAIIYAVTLMPELGIVLAILGVPVVALTVAIVVDIKRLQANQ